LNNLFTALITKRIVATVSALVVVAIGCGAGYWQLSRANTKIALAANLLARQQMPILKANERDWTLIEAAERRMTARGQYVPDAAIWLDNRPRPLPVGGTSNPAPAGFYLMKPFRLEGADMVLWVNRGWAPRNQANRETLPPVQTPTGPVSIDRNRVRSPGKGV
jgi:surfeit locus 1 family protein